MFDIGWTEMMVVACVAIIVVGPKDLPRMLRTFGKAIGNIRRMAGDFQRQFNDAIQETELNEAGKTFTESKTFQPLADAKKAMEDFQETMKAHEAQKKPSDLAEGPQQGGGVTSAGKKAAPTEAGEGPKSDKKTPARKPVAKKTTARKPKASKPKTAKASPAKSTRTRAKKSDA